MCKKPWGGRFKKQTDKLMEKFSESVSYDKRLYEEDIQGSIAHANMLSKTGIIKNAAVLPAFPPFQIKINHEIKIGIFKYFFSVIIGIKKSKTGLAIVTLKK